MKVGCMQAHGGFCHDAKSMPCSCLLLPRLSTASRWQGCARTSHHQLIAGCRGRAVASVVGRFLRPAKGPRRHRRLGEHHRYRPQHHFQGIARTERWTRMVCGTHSTSRGRSAARGDQVPGVLTALEELLQDATAGDPITGLKWTHRSLRKLCKALRRQGIKVSPHTIARLLRSKRFSLRTCRKQRAGLRHADRDRQFRYLVRLRRLYITRGWPVISVDTKKKEWVGDFKNLGQCWRREARSVLDHDFPSWAVGRAIPVGVFDLVHNDGLIVIGTSHETPTFAVSAIRRWWLQVGRHRYGDCGHLLIEADSGGANDHRK
jgi:hypothetical protein